MGAASRRDVARVLAGMVVAASLAVPAAAGAATVAYTDNGEVWLSSLDGAQKVKLASPVVNGDGDTEKWLDVAHSDGGRIVAVRNKPGRMSNFSWFKVWEPDGTSTVEGPLNAPSGWTVYVYPLGFDITADGKHLVYGYSNSGSCCPISFAQGTYSRPATNSVLAPIELAGVTGPSLLGNRIVGLEDGNSPNVVQTQNAGGNPYNDEFTPWLDTTAVGMDLNHVDVAANGQMTALTFETWDGGTQTVGKLALLTTQGVDTAPAFGQVDCFVPAAGVARGGSLSADATMVAWKDEAGLKVAGTPTTTADPCVMGSAPVVISATGEHPAIGGADIARFLPPPTPPTTTGPAPTPPTTTGPAATATAPVFRLPARLTAKTLGSARGAAIGVDVGGPGPVTVTGRVPARVLGRRGKPVIVARGQATATAAGRVTVRLRLTPAARKRVRRLRGARLALRVVHAGRATTKSITLR